MNSEENVIEISGLTKRFKDVLAVDALDLSVKRGDVFGFLGPNGAGKSTTIRMMLSLISPTSGCINIFGKSLTENRKELLTNIGAIVEKPDFYLYLPAIKNLEILAKISGKEVTQNRICELLELVGLKDRAKSKVKTYSHGMKQRLGIAQALLHNPELVVLDEPTTGLDPDARQGFWKLVTDLKQQGCGVLLTTHYMDEAQRLCDRLLLLQQGRVIDQGTPPELIERTVGQEAVEIEGVPEVQLQALATEAGTWCRPFGSGYLLALPLDHPEPLWHRLAAAHPARLTRRQANLEDVFLRLTGSLLQ